MSEIKPCPFYDGHDDAEVRQATIPARYDYQRQEPVAAYTEYRVVCNECNCGGPAGLTEEQAIESWNTRSTVAL